MGARLLRSYRRPLLLGAVVVLALVVVAVVAVVAVRQLRTAPAAPGFFVDPTSAAAQQERTWREQGRTEDARRVAKIAEQPQPEWLTAPTGRVADEVDRYVSRAVAAGQRPLLVTYHVPDRDCGSYSGGGAADDADYRAWVRQVAAGLQGRVATVVLEPDAVPHEVTGCPGGLDRQARAALLADAVAVLKDAGPTVVYLDAGNPGFASDVATLAGALRESGVERADGFSLNVANFYPTEQVVDFGHRLSDALGDAHFVIDTGRNGNGRVDGSTVDGGPAYCNPPGRALGDAPTTRTGRDRVDAYLWIKTVGASDGTCRPGEPPAGQWWPEYALSLVPR